jgi:tetratricopeptide (TPR) repeat protein
MPRVLPVAFLFFAAGVMTLCVELQGQTPLAQAAPGPVAEPSAIQGPATQAPAAKPPTARRPPATRQKAARGASFDDLAARAEHARTSGDLPQAIALYTQALEANPSWDEGHWALGTAYYELDRFEEARDQFRLVLTAHGDNGTAWAFKGLCEFRLKNYDVALTDLMQARTHGVGGSRAVADVARFHTALLATRTEQYEQALAILSDFALEGNDSPSIIEAMGIATLRIPVLPDELPGEKREMVMMAGRAAYFMAARLASATKNAFEALVSRYPEAPNVHYAQGVSLLAEEPAAAVEAFKRELKRYPHNTWATVQVAFSYIRLGEFELAKPFAEQAVAQAPTEFVTRNALGQVRLETGDVEGAIAEFEAGVRLAPDSPQMHFALARAYRRAGRDADADRAQAEFIRLDRLVRTSRTGESSVGGIATDTPPRPGGKP